MGTLVGNTAPSWKETSCGMAQDRTLQKCVVFLFHRTLPLFRMPSDIWSRSDFLWPGASAELFGVLFIILVPIRPHPLVPGHFPTPLLAQIDLVHYCLINFATLYLHSSFSHRIIEGIFIVHGVEGNWESKSAQEVEGRDLCPHSRGFLFALFF